jgi:succinate dehydrogenase / fumarate reductase, cytochrome b subunit
MIVKRIFTSSVGKKIIMAVTGVGLFAFVVQHMLAHLIMFGGQDAYNTYVETMQGLAIKWPARGALLAGVLLHIWAAVSLSAANKKARPANYVENKNTGASLSSRTMLVTGLILAGFIVYHVLHFTIGVTHPDDFALTDATGRHDVYTSMIRAFSSPLLTFFYIGSMALLCMHLSHGVAAFFRSLGLMNGRWRKAEEQFALMSAGLVFIGFSTVPLAIIAGFIR